MYVPGKQDEHEKLPTVDAKEPAEHSEQAEDAGLEANVPTGHGVQELEF
jgi:hypothetical protein